MGKTKTTLWGNKPGRRVGQSRGNIGKGVQRKLQHPTGYIPPLFKLGQPGITINTTRPKILGQK